MEMIAKYRKFVKKFLETYTKSSCEDENLNDLMEVAIDLLHEDFKKSVIETFSYLITDSCNKQNNIEVINSGNKLDFVKLYMTGEMEEFIKTNWNKLDDIIEILQKQIEKNEN